MTEPVEFASGSRGLGGAIESCAKFLGLDLATTARAAATGRLGELIEQRRLTAPVRGAEALRQIEELRVPPWEERPTPAQRIGQLRAIRLSWAAEEQDSRDPYHLLAELRRQRAGWVA